ncbi:MAG: SRPBCC family protein [Bacteroidota bacterium]|nr:SRPBCC family protein [Bacteroidota bacterium]
MMNINLNAPVLCRKSIAINATSVGVWEVLTDINNWPSWQKDVRKSAIKGPLIQGTAFSWKSGGININSVIHTAEPYTLFGWSGNAIGLSAVHNWKIVELNKRTEVHVEESMEGILAKLFKKAMNKKVDTSLDKWLTLLKDHCEHKQ